MNCDPAYMDGWHAHRKEVAQSDNPYNETVQPYSYNKWLSGWCARFGTIKHGGDPSAFDNLEGLE